MLYLKDDTSSISLRAILDYYQHVLLEKINLGQNIETENILLWKLR